MHALVGRISKKQKSRQAEVGKNKEDDSAEHLARATSPTVALNVAASDDFEKHAKESIETEEFDQEKIMVSSEGTNKKPRQGGSEEQRVASDRLDAVSGKENLEQENSMGLTDQSFAYNVSAEVPGCDSRVMGILIHCTDRLKTKLYISHPLVKAYLLNAETGQPLPKTSRSRPVSYHLDGQQVSYILPLMTKPCDFRAKGLPSPTWEEMLLFNEPFEEIFRPGRNVLVIFELLDFATMSATKKAQEQEQDSEKAHGWHRIAWGFWKPRDGPSSRAANVKLRLQLYRSPRSKRQMGSDAEEVFYWWKHLTRIKYAGSLFLTVKALLPPTSLRATSRSVVAVQKEEPSEFTSAAEEFQYPSETAIMILACGAKETQSKFPIFLYEIPSGRMSTMLLGHLGIVYDLNWSKDSTVLISASADCTARLWNVSSGLCAQILPHTHFVYCALLFPRNEDIMFTGAYDKLIRIWMRTSGIEAQIMREVSGHSGYVNCLSLSKDNQRLVSGDSRGSVKFWSLVSQKQDVSKELNLHIVKEMSISDKKPINCLHFHPTEGHLYVHSRDNCIRCFDRRTSIQKTAFYGGLFNKMNIISDITPCGRYVISGTEDGRVLVWNCDSVLRMNEDGDRDEPIVSVAYHPFDHMMATGSFGEGAKLNIYRYDSSEPEIHSEVAENSETELRQTEADKSYMDFSVQKLLAENKILARLNSVEKKILYPDPLPNDTGQESLMDRKASDHDEGSFRQQPRNRAKKPPPKQVPSKPRRQETEILKEMEDDGTEGKEYLKAIYDYKEHSPDELSFSRGDEIEILAKLDDQWWIGMISGKQGYVPANFVAQF